MESSKPLMQQSRAQPSLAEIWTPTFDKWTYRRSGTDFIRNASESIDLRGLAVLPCRL